MDIYIYNRDRQFVGIMDAYTSYRQVERYNEVGEFELHTALKEGHMDILKMGYYIHLVGEREAGVIENITLKKDEMGKDIIVVSGPSVTGLLDRRISWDRIKYNGYTEDLIRDILNKNVINPSNPHRKIDGIRLDEKIGLPNRIQYQKSFGNVLEQLETITGSQDLGFRLVFDHYNFILDLYKGVDRSAGKPGQVIFSETFENILKAEYNHSRSDYKNTVLIAGQGDGDDRVIETIENGEGLDRYEMYVDARDIEDTVDNEPINPEIYREQLEQRGREKLSQQLEIKSFDSEINTYGNNKYREDFDLGDIVTFEYKNWGLMIDTRITEVETVMETSGKRLNIVFGEPLPTIIDKLMRGD